MSLKDRFKGSNEQRLQSDFQKLHEQHEMLNEKLGLIEQKTEAATQWLNEHETNIVTGYHDIARALRRKDTQQLNILSNNPAFPAILRMSPPAGMEWPDLAKSAIAPTSLADIIPAFNTPAATDSAEKKKPATEENAASNFGLWSRLTGSAEKELMEKIQQKEREILSLQTRVPYYVESFMDWVEAAVAPEPGGPLYDTPDKKAWGNLMLHHRDPLYTLTQAEKDLLAATDLRIAAMEQMAKDYDNLAAALESDDADAAISALGRHETKPHFKKMLGWLLERHDQPSLASFALEEFSTGDKRAAVFAKAVDVENVIALKPDAKNPAHIFAQILNNTLKDGKAMPLTILSRTIDWLEDKAADVIYGGKGEFFQLVAAHLKTQPEEMAKVMTTMMGSGGEALDITHGYADLVKAIDHTDGVALEKLIQTQGKAQQLGKILDFSAYITPDFDLTETIFGNIGKYKDGPRLLEALIDHGIDLWPKKDPRTLIHRALELAAASASQDSALPLFEKIVRIAEQRSDEPMIRLLTKDPHHIYKGNPPLARAAAGKQSGNDILRALLHPLQDNLERSYALMATAADRACPQGAADVLIKATRALSAGSIRYKTDSVETLLLPENIVSLWRENHLRYIHDGERRSLPGTGGNDDARVTQIVTVLSDNPAFLRTETELINPEKIEALYADETGLYGLTQGQILSITKDLTLVETLSSEIQDKNPSIVSAGGVLLNLHQLEFVSVTQDGLSIISHGKEYPVPIEDQEVTEVLGALRKNPSFAVGSTYALNLERVGALWPSSDNKEVAFSIGGEIFDSTAQEGSFHTGLAVDDASAFLKKMKLPSSFTQIGPCAANMNALFSVHHNIDDGSLTWIVDGRENNVRITKENKEKLFSALRRHIPALWEDAARSLAVNPLQAETITVHSDNRQCIFKSCGQDFPLDDVVPKKILEHLQKHGALTVSSLGVETAFWPDKISRYDASGSIGSGYVEILGPGTPERRDSVDTAEWFMYKIESQRRHALLPQDQAKLGDKMAVFFRKNPPNIAPPAGKLGDIRRFVPEAKKNPPSVNPPKKSTQPTSLRNAR